MRKFLLAILLMGVLALFFFLQPGKFPKNSLFEPKTASLVVETFPKNLPAFLDGKELGVTPLTRKNLLPGEHLLTLGKFEKKINLEAGTQNVFSFEILPSGQALTGYQVSYQSLPFWGAQKNFSIFVNEPEVQVSIVGERFKKSELANKLNLEQFPAGVYQLKIEKPGFLSQELNLEVLPNYLALVEIKLTPDLLFGLEKEDEILMIKATDELKENLKPAISSQWREESFDFRESKVNLSSWQSLSFFKLPYDPQKWDLSQEAQVFEYLNLLEFQSKIQKEDPGLPFCYLINEKGQVFEGLGVLNFDYSKIKVVSVQKGECPVAFLVSNLKNEILPAAKKSAQDLTQFLAQGQPLLVKSLTQLNTVELLPGEEREFSLEFQNQSSKLWQKNPDRRILLTLFQKEESSEFYHASWLSSWQITTFNEAGAAPFAKASFSFKIKAPFYPGQFEQKLILFDEESDSEIKGSEIKLNLVVKKEGALVIEIQKTPTGFLNVRSAPSPNADLLGSAYEGEKYLVLESMAGWYKVLLHNGDEGFVAAQYTREIGE